MKTNIYMLIIAILLSQCDNNITTEDKNYISSHGLYNIKIIDPTIKVDLKYSTEDNFLGEDLYGDLNSCFLQKEAVIKLANAQKLLKQIDAKYSLIIYDCMRPRSIQKRMWQKVIGTDKEKYVANPYHGSIHNYGCAVDLSIMEKNKLLDMGTSYDHFGKLAQPRHENYFLSIGKLSVKQVNNRKLLRKVMTGAGFLPIQIEWWHFNAFHKKIVKKKFKIIEKL